MNRLLVSVVTAVLSAAHARAQTGVIVWNNGSLIPGPCSPASACASAASRCILQDASQGLNYYGFGCSLAGGQTLTDDFTLNVCTDLTTIELFLYQTMATGPSVTNVTLRLHAGPAVPTNPTSNVLQSVTAGGVVTLEPIFRTLETNNDCTRRIQSVVLDVSSWPDLAPATYWISWQGSGSVASGPWCAPVVVCGSCGKPGANAHMATANLGNSFVPILDSGGGPGCENAPQDFPFIIRGNPCGMTCPANIVNVGTSINVVDVDDLMAVIENWGACFPAPAPCPANVMNFGSSANRVDVDDLLTVIRLWGPCPSP